MLKSPFRGIILALFLCFGLLGGAIHSNAVLAQTDATRFAELLSVRNFTPADFGPLAGEIVQDATLVASNSAGVSLADFSATATFANPVDDSAPWDMGFTFHITGETSQRIYIDSTGNWSYLRYPDGLVDSNFTAAFDASPGASNTLDLFVQGDTALFGVNGEYVATMLLPGSTASDVQVGTGFLDNTTVPDRVIPYDDFSLWQLQTGSDAASSETGSNVFRITVTPEASSSTTVTPAPVDETTVPTPAAGETNVDTADAESFRLLLESQAQATLLAGPFTANIKELQGQFNESWAGVNFDTFHATASFDVPADTSGVPWNIGFTFRTSPAGPMRISVDSLGNWYFVVGNASPTQSGTVSGVVTTPGSVNQLDLFVAEQRAVFGVNGQLAALIELPSDSTGGDIAASTGAFSDQTVTDRVTLFRDFQVLSFDPNVPSTQAEPAALSDADISEFAEYVEDTRGVTPLVGPFAGRLVDSSGATVPQAFAGVNLSNFGAVATFINPDDVDALTWDGGFQFRSDGDAVHRVVLRSNGEVFLVLPDGSTTIVGLAAAYDPTPGARNELQLFVNGDRALFGVNSELAAAVILPAPPVASDVIVGSPFFGEDVAPGRVVSYEGFSVWDMA